MRHTLIVWVASAAIATAQIDVVQRGRTTIGQLVRGDYAAVVQSFDEKVRALLPEDKLRAAWESIVVQAGPFQRIGEPELSSKGDASILVFPAEFQRAKTNIQIVFNAAGQIIGLNIRPAASTVAFVDAPYVDRAKFTEQEVTVDAGGWPLPGTLTIPIGSGPFPAVVLVHGSGPADRDTSFGPNKPFRDLAHGLASRGVAVLRYEKRTRQFAAKIAALKQFTVKEETVDDAVAAVRLLRKTDRIDPGRVFVLGHSLGGMVAPRIALAAGGDLRGLIIMAGAVRSLQQALVEQSRYLALADGTISPEEQKQIDQFAALEAKVRTMQATDPPVTVAAMSAPASYLVDLRGYDPPTAARPLKLPMMILHGGRDYQVTLADFERWKEALGSRKDVTFKLYPPLNHLFIPGTGKSLPAEYFQPGHVAAEVVDDVASWVNSIR
jgi:dienelactone hydrolase